MKAMNISTFMIYSVDQSHGNLIKLYSYLINVSLILNVIIWLAIRSFRVASFTFVCYLNKEKTENTIWLMSKIIHEKRKINPKLVREFAKQKQNQSLPQHCNHFSNQLYNVQFVFVHRGELLDIRHASHHHHLLLYEIDDWQLLRHRPNKQSQKAFLARDDAIDYLKSRPK